MAYKCSSRYLTIKKTSTSNTTYKMIPLKCGSWDCQACASEKWYNIKKKIESTFSGDVWLLTLTFEQKNININDVWKQIGERWNRLLSYIRKVHKKKVKFIRIVEPHKTGYPHLHIILDKAINFTEELKLLISQGFGNIAHQKIIPIQAGLQYLSKYLTKGTWSDKAKVLRKKYRVRIFSSSRLDKIIQNPKDNWSTISVPQSAMSNALLLAEEMQKNVLNGFKLSTLTFKNSQLIIQFNKTPVQQDIDFSVLSDIQISVLFGTLYNLYNLDRDNDNLSTIFHSFCESTNTYNFADLKNNPLISTG